MDFKLEASSDTVRYRVFFTDSVSRDVSLEELGKMKGEMEEWIKQNFTRDFLWQKDPFQLCMKREMSKNKRVPVHLEGETCFGDNIEDEWFIVLILFKLSERFEVICTVEDEDGQFLLIEAAHHIPPWLEPHNSDNRVFVKGGKLHLIPLPSNPSQMLFIPSQPDLASSLELLVSPENKEGSIESNYFSTLASREVQESIWKKLRETENSAKRNNKHFANAFIPASIAYSIIRNPQLLSKAVEAFYYRDLEDMKNIQKMSRYNPKNPINLGGEGEPWIMYSVRFTRCLFAQICRQEIVPPKQFSSSIPLNERDPTYRPKLLGMKLACAFEILYQRASSELGRPAQPFNAHKTLFDWNFDTDQDWAEGLKKLNEKKYFQEFPSESKEYKKLLLRAKMDYVSTSKFKEKIAQKSLFENVKTQIDEHTSQLASQISNILPSLKELKKEDGEEWMQVSPQQVDDILFDRQKEIDSFYQRSKSKSDGENVPPPVGVEEMLGDLKSFFKKVSSFEGVEMPEKETKFSVERFMDTLQRAVGLSGEAGEGEEGEFDVEDEMEKEELFEKGEEGEEEMLEMMEEMDKELRENHSNIFAEFEMERDNSELKEHKVEKSEGVDINLNLVKNILHSLEEQNGECGPLTNLLSQLSQSKKK